jgi:hypothetical protein
MVAGLRQPSRRGTRARSQGAEEAGASRIRAALAVSIVALVSMLASSVVGLAVEGLYGDPLSTASMLRAFDLVTLVVVVPLLGLAVFGVWRGSARAWLLWLGLLAGSVYTYAYYLFGTGFNDGFLIHIGAFAASLFALILALSSVDMTGISQRFSPRVPRRWIGGFLGVLAIGLGGMWLAASIGFAVTDDLPAGSVLVETPAVVHLGIALDLAILVPLYGLAAVLLLRRRAWGYLLAAIALVSGTVHQLAYLVAMPFQVDAGVPGASAVDPFEPPIALGFLIAASALLLGVRSTPDPAGVIPPAK